MFNKIRALGAAWCWQRKSVGVEMMAQGLLKEIVEGAVA